MKAKDSLGSATLSMAYAGSRFASSVADALAGVEGVTECAFVESDKVDGLSFFSTPCKFGVSFKCGVGGVVCVVCVAIAIACRLDDYEAPLLSPHLVVACCACVF